MQQTGPREARNLLTNTTKRLSNPPTNLSYLLGPLLDENFLFCVITRSFTCILRGC